MSLLDRWVANTKRVLAKDKNTGSEYEFESIFPDGAPDGTAFNSENMNKIIDAVNGLDEGKGQPGGIATLNGSGKLAQMPTAADVGAVPSSAYLPLVPYYSAGATTSDSAIYFAAEGLVPGVYLLLASGNHNPRGAEYYRSVCSAILLLSCGHNSTAKQVVYRVKIGTSSSASGTSGVADSNFAVGFDGMAAEIQRTAATAKVFIRLSRNSAASTADNWDVRLHKLI